MYTHSKFVSFEARVDSPEKTLSWSSERGFFNSILANKRTQPSKLSTQNLHLTCDGP